MPVRGSVPSCWSCGLDPKSTPDTVEPRRAATQPTTEGASGRRPGRLAAGVVVLVLAVVAAALTLLVPGDGGDGVRGISARLRNGQWQRAELRGASAAFPTTPLRQALVAGLDPARSGESLVAERDGVRAELMVADVGVAGTLVDGAAVADRLVSGYAAATDGQVVQRTPLYRGGSPGVDAVVDGGRGTTRVRATVGGTTAYLMAVTGPEESFRRFTESFRGSA